MYQKEFAERMIAKPGSKDYSRLSVMIYYKTDCEILEIVPKDKFYPKPKVDCCIVKLAPRERKPFRVSDEKLFEDLTKTLFMHRRKKIRNGVKSFCERNGIPYRVEDIPYLERRVDSLYPEQIGEIADAIYRLKFDARLKPC
jgi:16S rRNA (adenine1518-N6/adenine1519-N6)-dimethyltransferase